jgi:hypothetical protein
VRDRAGRALAALLLLLAFPGAAPAKDDALSATLRRAEAKIDWTDLHRSERLLVLRRIGRGPRVLDKLVDRVSRRVAIHRGADSDPSGGNHTDHQFGGGRPWEVNLSADVLNRESPLNAHYTLHELGHVVDGALIREPLRERLFALFRRSPGWQNCYPMPLGSSSRCVSRPELFAEQFAFWATGNGTVRTAYNVPPLASRRAFTRLLATQVR